MKILLLTLLISFSSFASECANDRTALAKIFKQEAFPATWRETTANDGKPLIVRISELKEKLHLEFDKTNEGLWAKGTADVCAKEKGGVEAKITKEQIKLGAAAPWILRMSMKGGANFSLELRSPGNLHISTFGWSGDFVPEEETKKAN